MTSKSDIKTLQRVGQKRKGSKMSPDSFVSAAIIAVADEADKALAKKENIENVGPQKVHTITPSKVSELSRSTQIKVERAQKALSQERLTSENLTILKNKIENKKGTDRKKSKKRDELTSNNVPELEGWFEDRFGDPASLHMVEKRITEALTNYSSPHKVEIWMRVEINNDVVSDVARDENLSIGTVYRYIAQVTQHLSKALGLTEEIK